MVSKCSHPPLRTYGSFTSSPAEGGEEVKSEVASPTRPIRCQAIFVVLCCGALALSTHSLSFRRRWSSSLRDSVHEARAMELAPTASDVERPPSQVALSFQAVNSYHIRDGKPGVAYPWLLNVTLVEPYRNTTFSVDNPVEKMTYRWTVTATADYEVEPVVALGSSAVLRLKHLGENTVFLEEISPTGEVVRILKEDVICKYVRREIRTLEEDEREELFDAMLTLWDIHTDEGKSIYGDGYVDVWDINRLHHSAASDIVCDHFHDGLGFLTSHMILTNTFEYSLQLVNPKLTVPYWDFTIDTAIGKPERFLDDCPLFQESWFGSADPSDQQVKNGRWALVEVPTVGDEMGQNTISNAYGKLRAPWNTNNRQYITRGFGDMCGDTSFTAFPLPTCYDHYSLSTSHNTFYGWVWDSMYESHGSIHIWIGGILDCRVAYAQIADLVGKKVATTLRGLAFIHRKNLFRDGLFVCREDHPQPNSSVEVMEEGYCGCLNHNLDSGDDFYAILNTLVFVPEMLEGYSNDTKRDVVRLICQSPVSDGDELQSTSSLDPSFWPIHPTMERLFLYKFLTGTMTDLTWPDHDTTYTDEDGENFIISISLGSTGEEPCKGHAGSDIFPFELDGIMGDGVPVHLWGKSEVNTFSNREILGALDPNVDALPYIYDTFTWPHCEGQGFDFEDVSDQSASTYSSAQSSSGGSRHGRVKGKVTSEEAHDSAQASHVVPESTKTISDAGGEGRPRHDSSVKRLGKEGDEYAIFREGSARHPLYRSLLRDLA